MLHVSIKQLNYSTKVLSMDKEDISELYALGFWNTTVNNSLKSEPSKELIEKAANIFSKYYGRITKYTLWACDVCGFRIVFGN